MSLWMFFVLGICIGSFLNVLIDRLPKGQTIWGRSRCDHCKKTLSWYELIPVFSWIIQRARCRRCRKPIAIQYPLVELMTGIGFIFLYPKFASIIVFCALLVIFFADLKYQVIPDSMLLVALIGGTWEYIGFGILAALFFFLLWLVTKGKGMGLGDVKLAFVLGFLLGFPKILIALYVAFLTGATIGVILILVHRANLKTKIAFGPFMILGSVIASLYETQILSWFHAS